MKSIAQSINRICYALTICFVIAMSCMSFQNSAMKTGENCPNATFVIQNNGCKNPCAIIFNNQSTGGVSYHWDFGDGNFSTVKSPMHRYAQTGNFQVKLTVIGEGCTAEFIGTVDVISE